MSAFHETLRKIFSVVDGFLNTTLKNESLGKTAEKERKKIVELLQKLYSDYEYLNPSNADEGSSSSSRDATQDESRNTLNSTHSNEEEAYIDDISETTVKALVNPFKIGYLQKKRTDILGIFSKQKCYCVLHKNVMYWFKKPADKKQQGAFFVTDYEFREIPQSDKEIAKKEFPFEMICIGKKTYQFVAESKEDLDGWKQAVATASKYVVTPLVSGSVSEEMVFETGDDLYEPLEEVTFEVKKKLNQPSPKPLPDLPQKTFHVPELDDFDQPIEDDIYDPAESEKPTAAPQLPSRNTQLPPIPSAASPIIDEPDDLDDEIYEFVDGLAPLSNTALSVPNTTDQRSSIPTSPPPLPPHEKVKDDIAPPPLPSRFQPSEKPVKELPPLPKRKRVLTLGNANLSGDDYENMYYGIWKCMGMTENELSFDQGDIIHIINRELDAENWWVGELKGQIGLVPKPFLCQAYEIVAG